MKSSDLSAVQVDKDSSYMAEDTSFVGFKGEVGVFKQICSIHADRAGIHMSLCTTLLAGALNTEDLRCVARKASTAFLNTLAGPHVVAKLRGKTFGM